MNQTWLMDFDELADILEALEIEELKTLRVLGASQRGLKRIASPNLKEQEH